MDPVPNPILPEKFLGYSRESNPGPLGWQLDVLTTIPNRWSFLCKEQLKTELSVMCKKHEFHNISGFMKMYKIVLDTGIGDSCTEVFTFLKIILTN